MLIPLQIISCISQRLKGKFDPVKFQPKMVKKFNSMASGLATDLENDEQFKTTFEHDMTELAAE